MFHIALYQPEIPPNTGNIIRLCANSGAQLHLIRPLAFEIDDKHLRRASLDYYEFTHIELHEDSMSFKNFITGRLFACSTKGKTHYDEIQYLANDVFLFGPETRGLPQDILHTLPKQQIIRIPMLPHSRSLNLSNSVAVILYEAWRQLNFCGGI